MAATKSNIRSRSAELVTMVKKSSVTKRWLVSIFSVIIPLLIIIVVSLTNLVHNYYYSNIEQTIIRRASIAATYFTATSGSATVPGNTAEYITAAQSFIEGFEYRDKMELQFLDDEGRVLVTSTGFEPGLDVDPAFVSASDADNGIKVYIGKSTQGEDILAVTNVMRNSSGKIFGAVRVAATLEIANKTIVYIALMLILLAVGIMLCVLLSGMYFIRSIVNPIKGITASASKIAGGDFEIRLQSEHNDEIGELVESINSMAGALAEGEQLKNDFITSVSHELRTPLTAIKGWGETIRTLDPETEGEMFQKGVGVIIRESERLSGLVESLLDFSRLQSGRMTVNLEKLDILAELGDAVYMFYERAIQEEKMLKFFEADMLPAVMGDRDRLKQVFVNLIDNAMKYSEKGSEIHVTAAQEGDNIVIMVRDFGCGIAPEDIPLVTKRFYKANFSKRGFGIGLGVADEIIHLHGGSLKITSKLGEGTVVTVMLPIATQDKPTEEIN